MKLFLFNVNASLNALNKLYRLYISDGNLAHNCVGIMAYLFPQVIKQNQISYWNHKYVSENMNSYKFDNSSARVDNDLTEV